MGLYIRLSTKGVYGYARFTALALLFAFFLLHGFEFSQAVTSSSTPNATLYRPSSTIGGNVSMTLYGDGTIGNRDNVSGNEANVTILIVNASGFVVNQSTMTIAQFILNSTDPTYVTDTGYFNDLNATQPWEGGPDRNLTYPSGHSTRTYYVNISTFFSSQLNAPDPRTYGHVFTLKLNATYSNSTFPYPSFLISNSSLNFSVNSAPTIANVPDNWTLEDTTPSNRWYNFSQYSQDNDNDTLTYAITETNSSLIDCFISESTFMNCSMPSSNQYGNSTITVNASDGIEWSTDVFVVFVNSSNDIPSSTAASPANGSVSYVANVTFNCTASDVEGLLNISLYANFTGSWQLNETVNVSGTSNSSGFNRSLGSAVYSWGCRAGDVDNVTSFSSNYTLTVNVDTSPPQWVNNTTAPSSPIAYLQNRGYWLNISVTDDKSGVQKVLLENNFTGTLANYTLSNESSIFYYSYSDLKASNYTYKWYMNDSVGNSNSTFRLFYSVVIAANPIDVTFRNTSGEFKSQNVTITYPSSINVTLGGKGPLFLFRDNQNVTNTTNTYIVLAAKPSGYEYKANSSGNENFTSNDTGAIFYLFINRASPAIQLLLNGTAANISVVNNTAVNATAMSNNLQGNVTLYRNGSFAQTNQTPLINISVYSGLPGNETNMTAFYNETQNYSSQAVTYWVKIINESQPPKVVNLTAKPPSLNHAQSTNISANVTDNLGLNSVNVNITFPNGTVITLSLSQSGDYWDRNFTASVIDPAGLYTARIVATDTSGNVNSTEAVNFTVNDTTAPRWSSNTTSPAGWTNYSKGQSYQFNVTWFEETSFNVTLIEHNFNGSYQNYSLTGFEGARNRTYYYNWPDLPAGTYFWRELFNDSSGNPNVTANFTFIVNKDQSKVNLTINGTYGNVTAEVGELNLTMFRDNGETNVSLYVNGSLVAQGTNFSLIQNFSSVTIFNVTVVHNGSQNFTLGSLTRFVNATQDTTPPRWENNQSNASLAKKNTQVFFNITLKDNSLGIKYYIFSHDNGTNISVNDTAVVWSDVVTGVQIIKNVSANKTQTIRWRWFFNDSQGLWNSTPLFNATVLNFPPTLSGIPDNWTLEDTIPPNRWFNLSSYTVENDNDTLTYYVYNQSNSSLISCLISELVYVNCSKPALNRFGNSTIWVNVTDGQEWGNDTFVVFVNSSNDPPALIGFNATIIESNTTGKEAYLISNPTFNTSNTGLMAELGAGKTNSSFWNNYSGVLRGMIEFNLSSVPPGVNVTKSVARFFMPDCEKANDNCISTFYYIYNQSHNILVTAHRVTESWEEGTGRITNNSASVNGAAWYERRYGINWGSAGGSFAAAEESVPVNDTGWYSFTLTDAIRAFHNGTSPNYGILLKGPEVSQHEEKYFCTSDLVRQYCDAPSNIPRLEVTYEGIPEQRWMLNTDRIINLTKYFEDADGDDLNYTFTSITNVTITVDNSTNLATLTPDTDFMGTRYVVFTAYDPAGASKASNNMTLFVGDLESPRWGNQSQDSSSLTAGSDAYLRAYWTDNVNLSKGWLSQNSSGSWANSSFINLSAPSNWTNFTFSTTGLGGSVVAWRIYANDSSGNQNSTATMTFSVQSVTTTTAGQAGAYGSSPAAAPAPSAPKKNETQEEEILVSFFFPLVSPSSPADFRVLDGRFSLSRLKIEVKKEVPYATFVIKIIRTLPSPVPSIGAYQYFQVEAFNIGTGDVESVEMDFDVERTWMSLNNVSNDEVALFRFAGKWEQLPTTFLRETNTKGFYRATSPGFSYFAIAKGVKGAAALTGKAVGEAVAPQGFDYRLLAIGVLPLSAAMAYMVKKRKRKAPTKQQAAIVEREALAPVKKFEPLEEVFHVEVKEEKPGEKGAFEIVRDRERRSNAFIFSGVKTSDIMVMKPLIEGCAVTKMRMRTSSPLEKATVSLAVREPLEMIAEGMLLVPRTYQYFHLEAEGTEAKDIKEMVVQFKVSKIWMASVACLPEEVHLMRHSLDWKEQETQLFSRDPNHFYYVATVKGLGDFAISRRRPP